MAENLNTDPVSESDLLNHYDDPYHRGGCDCTTHAAEMVCHHPSARSDSVDDSGENECRASAKDGDSKNEVSAGDTEASSVCAIRFELAIDDELQIAEAWWDGQGCMWCEGFASILCERTENLNRETALATARELSKGAESSQGGNVDSGASEPESAGSVSPSEGQPARACVGATIGAFMEAWRRPVQDLDDDLADGSQFGGPSLREEC